MLNAYLRDLERELARSLPPEDVQARLAEAEAHLQDGVEARLELGLDLTEAERETVAAFGGARRLAEAADHRGHPMARLLCLGTGYVLALLWTQCLIGFTEALPQLNVWLFQAWFALGLIFAALAFLARRPRPAVIFLTVLGSTTLTWLVLGTTWLDLTAFGGSGVVPRNTAEGVAAEDRKLLKGRQENRLAFDAGWKTLQGAQGIDGLRLPTGYRAPSVDATYPYALRFASVPDARTAVQAWADVRRHSEAFETAQIAQNLSAMAEAQAHPWQNALAMVPGIFEANAGVAAAAILVDYAFGGLGTLLSRRRKDRRRGLA